MESTAAEADSDSSRPKRVAWLAGAWVRVAVGAPAALLSSLVGRRGRETLLRLAGELGHPAAAGPEEIIPAIPHTDAAGEGIAIVVREPIARDGNVSLFELVTLDRMVAARKPRRVFEIGSFDFRTTINLAANSDPEAEVYTLDLPAAASPAFRADHDDAKYIGRGREQARPATPEESSRIRVLTGDSAKFDFEPYARGIDFVFVDGAHSREYVHRDSLSALHISAPHGVVVWHDYGVWPGVTAGLNELFRHDARFRRLRRIEQTSLVVLDRAARL